MYDVFIDWRCCTCREAETLHDAMREALSEQDEQVARLQGQLAQLQPAQQQQQQQQTTDHQPPALQPPFSAPEAPVGSRGAAEPGSTNSKAEALPVGQQPAADTRAMLHTAHSDTLSSPAAASAQPQPADNQKPEAAGCRTDLATAAAAMAAAEPIAVEQQQQLQQPAHCGNDAGTHADEQADPQQLQAAQQQQHLASSPEEGPEGACTRADEPQQSAAPADRPQSPGGTAAADVASGVSSATVSAAPPQVANDAAAPVAAAAGGVGDTAAAIIRDLSMQQAALAAQVQELQDERQQLQVGTLSAVAFVLEDSCWVWPHWHYVTPACNIMVHDSLHRDGACIDTYAITGAGPSTACCFGV
jgi:DNA repair exonuclease SbcCD ATPase subunit